MRNALILQTHSALINWALTHPGTHIYVMLRLNIQWINSRLNMRLLIKTIGCVSKIKTLLCTCCSHEKHRNTHTHTHQLHHLCSFRLWLLPSVMNWCSSGMKPTVLVWAKLLWTGLHETQEKRSGGINNFKKRVWGGGAHSDFPQGVTMSSPQSFL